MDFQTYLEVSPYRPFPWDARVVSLDFQVAVTPAFGGHGGPSDDYIIQDDFVPLADLEAPVDEGPTGVEPQATTADPGHVEKLERPKPKSYAKFQGSIVVGCVAVGWLRVAIGVERRIVPGVARRKNYADRVRSGGAGIGPNGIDCHDPRPMAVETERVRRVIESQKG